VAARAPFVGAACCFFACVGDASIDTSYVLVTANPSFLSRSASAPPRPHEHASPGAHPQRMIAVAAIIRCTNAFPGER
jgi:hypothetical protein